MEARKSISLEGEMFWTSRKRKCFKENMTFCFTCCYLYFNENHLESKQELFEECSEEILTSQKGKRK